MRKIKRRPLFSVIDLANIVEDALSMDSWYPVNQIKRNNLLLVLDKNIDKENFGIDPGGTNPNMAYWFRFLYSKWKYYLQNPPHPYYGPEDNQQGWFFLQPKKVDRWFNGFKGLEKYQTRRYYTNQLVKSNLLLRDTITNTSPTRIYYKINLHELLRRYQLQRKRADQMSLQFVNFDKLTCHPVGDFDNPISNNNIISNYNTTYYNEFALQTPSNSLRDRSKTSLKKSSRPERSRTKTKSPLRKKLKIRELKKRTSNPTLDKVISHWSSLGHPFAKVNKPQVLYPLIRKAAKSSMGYKEVIQVIDKAFEYMCRTDFKFTNSSNFAMKSFFEKPYNKSLVAKFFAENKLRTWYTTFRTKSPEWIEDNCLNIPKIKDQEMFDYIYNYFRDIDRITAIVASNKMYSFAYKNGTNIVDFDRYFREVYPDIRDFKLYWLKSDKFWNNQFAKYLVKFGRFKNIDQVNKI